MLENKFQVGQAEILGDTENRDAYVTCCRDATACQYIEFLKLKKNKEFSEKIIQRAYQQVKDLPAPFRRMFSDLQKCILENKKEAFKVDPEKLIEAQEKEYKKLIGENENLRSD